ncbi:MAG: NADH-quinone oxidoreductase subunit L [Chloroflexi bacterium]|jgi:NADH-quinone oxidoreductase subunit L|uniref:NADH-quinone oxidoreductase subunit L n=1 Tax=Candidatus Thermofonsia Clade 3 bacterium TaxID=2364212 RepID=A0A2M8QCH1_9CHLR|nr:NADH-quinone oxidoreductase subunit L [Candidatus Roseilinea sp. NK_OTU-006]PJF47494.1 MAG: NADH-quinone oxidoreductase subunit L [Candidatus Thermofonsia Clade 3 bacterium]RMG62797.1 MAG: NADH-quinone oxidoreductase subunit L [Chloroflexota bacterium]
MSHETLTTLLWLAPLPPILAFAVIALFTNRHRQTSSTIAVLAMIASLVMSFIVFFSVWQMKDLGKKPIGGQVGWLPTGETVLNIGVVVDPLGATFLFMVPLACTLIFIYSIGYMSADPRYTRFFAYLSLFAGSMMGLVVSDNLLTLFIFWELMGFCSYSLIGFFYQKPSAYKAAVKAFMTTRVGDMLLLLGMVYLYAQTGTLNFHAILHNEEVLKELAATPAVLGLGISAAGLIAILIFGGTVGKSAQWPLHVWLPDAMEGPTPVSAMIHAATMVSAGIFMLLRFFPLLLAAGEHSAAFTIVGLIGAFTAFLGATIAVAQYDIKRVLAFSTISQLGFMVAAVGIGAYVAAAFHLLTHAFFKALLFLASGSVIHGMEHGHHHVSHAHHSGHEGHPAHGHDAHSEHTDPTGDDGHAFDPQDMRNMGGLRARMPITFVTFLIGGLALAGFPFITAGFWSKDEIFADAYYHGLVKGDGLATLVFLVLVVSALLTAFYTMRQIAMTFLGQPRTEAAAHATESVPSMTFPLIVLAVFALFIGFINIPKDFPIFGALMGDGAFWLKNFIASMLLEKPEPLAFNIVPVLFSIGVALGGLALGWLVYARNPLQAGQTDPVEKLPVFNFLYHRWYWDELYRKIFINPLQAIADNYSRVVDKGVIDRILEGGYALGARVTQGFAEFDRVVITGFSDAVGRFFRSLGDWGRELQTGQVQNYLLSGLIMVIAILVFFLFLFQ